jgi:WD40 repeat protein
MAGGPQPVLAMAQDREGARLVVARGGMLEIRDLKAEGFPVRRAWTAHVDSVKAVGWSPDGAWVVSGGFRALRVWNAADGTLAWESKGWAGEVGALCFSEDGGTLWVGDSLATRGGYLAVVDWAERKVGRVWKAHEDSILGLALAPDGKSVVSAGADKRVRRWDAVSRAGVATYEGHTNQVLGVVYDPLKGRIATPGADREIKVWEVSTREQDAVLGDKRQVYSALGWSADGKALVGVSDRGQGTIFSEIGKHEGAQSSAVAKVQNLPRLDALLQSVAVAHDAGWVVAGASDGRLFLWRSRDGKWAPLGDGAPQTQPDTSSGAGAAAGAAAPEPGR